MVISFKFENLKIQIVFLLLIWLLCEPELVFRKVGKMGKPINPRRNQQESENQIQEQIIPNRNPHPAVGQKRETSTDILEGAKRTRNDPEIGRFKGGQKTNVSRF